MVEPFGNTLLFAPSRFVGYKNNTREKQVIKTIIIYNFSSMNKKERTISFLWQHLWLLVSLFIMTLGVAVCVKSELGSSVISTLPYVFETAGKRGLGVPSLTIGQYTYIMNAILVAGQIAVLRRRFEPVQLFQLLVGFVFGSLIDLNMALTSWLLPDGITEQALAQIAGCTVLGIGIALDNAWRGFSGGGKLRDRHRLPEDKDCC